MKANYKKLKCCYCGKRFEVGNTNGMPNGVGLKMASGKIYDVCQECISYKNKEVCEFIQKAEKG